jgi:phosphonate transport system substrate-binding protein
MHRFDSGHEPNPLLTVRDSIQPLQGEDTMTIVRRATSTALFALLTLTTPPASAAEALSLSFGVYTSDKPTDMYRMFKPVLLHLETVLAEKLGKLVQLKLRVFNTYDAARESLVKGELDLARFGPSSYILAKAACPGITILAIEEQEGQYEFKGVIFTREDTGIDSIEDLRGRSFAFGDPDSTIGRYLSQKFLVDAGILARDLARYDHFDRHDQVVEAVIGGRFDAGVAKEGTFNKFKDKGLKVLKTFPNITKPWVARQGLDPTVAKAIAAGLAGLKDKKVLDAMGEKVTGFNVEHARDERYDPVREGMKKAEAFARGAPPQSPTEARPSPTPGPAAPTAPGQEPR